jgi:RNA 2',3'-cyclic 3'-phosphodiesterase
VNSSGSVEGGERIRLFCALTLSDDTLDRIEAWQAALAVDGVRIVPRENLHVTLAFLGHRPAEELEAIGRELAKAAAGAGEIMLHARRYVETRNVGMVVLADERGAAGALALDLHGRLERLGVYEREQREWLPHLTVLRFRERPRLKPEWPRLEAAPSGAAVYMSQLRPGGAEYVVVEKFRLGGG